MINSLMLLAFEANGVIALRTMKLMRGGTSARDTEGTEASLMLKAGHPRTAYRFISSMAVDFGGSILANCAPARTSAQGERRSRRGDIEVTGFHNPSGAIRG